MNAGWALVVLLLLRPDACNESEPAAPTSREQTDGKGFRGFVCDREGKAIAGARVMVDYRHQVETGDDGTFFVPHQKLTRAEGELLVLIRTKGEEKTLCRTRFVDYARGEENITFRLKPTSNVSGWILTPDGKPVAGASVAALLHVGALTCHGTMPVGKPVESNDKGHFRIEGLYPDTRYRLRVSARRRERKVTDWIPVGSQVLLEKLNITLRDAPGIVEGTVVDGGGRPLSGKRVILGHPCIPDAVCISDEDGKFRIADLVPGEEVSLSVAWEFRKVKVNSRDVVLVAKERK